MENQICRSISLSPGITLHHLETHRFKTGRMTLVFRSPLTGEEQTLAALLPAVLSRGSVHHPSLRSINRALEELYDPTLSCRTSRMGDVRLLSFRLSFLEGRHLPEKNTAGGRFFDAVTEGAFDLLTELLLDPLPENSGGGFRLREEFTAMERDNLLTAIRSEKSDKAAYALRRCIEELCRGEAYAVGDLGREEDLPLADGAALTAFYRRMLQTHLLDLFYVGEESADRLAAYFQDRLAALLPFARSAPSPLTAPPAEVSAPVRRVTERQPVFQGKLALGCRMRPLRDSLHLPVFLLFREVLSSSPTSKLFLNVREKEGLCYDCSATGDLLKGILCIGAGIDPSTREKTEEAVYAQLRQMAEGNVTADEWENAKRTLCAALREISDSPAAMTNWYLRETVLGGGKTPPRSPKETEEAVRQTRIEEVAALAQTVRPQVSFFLRDDDKESEREENRRE